MRPAPNLALALILLSACCGITVAGVALAGQAADASTPAAAAPDADKAASVAATNGTLPRATGTPEAAPAAAPAARTADQSADAKVTCRTVKVTGSRLQTRKVCSTPDSEKASADWVREQQARGAIGASAILNGGQ